MAFASVDADFIIAAWRAATFRLGLFKVGSLEPELNAGSGKSTFAPCS
jgi:hypothetical protein